LIEERAREGSQHLPNRNTAPATATAPQGQSRSGTTTPDASNVQTPATPASSNYIPAEVREYMRSSMVPCRVILSVTNLLIAEWQKYYDDALAQGKSPNTNIVLLGSQSAGQGQQGWNNVGGKTGGKGGNPWGTQKSNSPSLTPFSLL
jgi:hypothetical protein